MNRDQLLKQLEPITNLGQKTVAHDRNTRVMFGVEPTFYPGGRGRSIPLSQEGIESLAGFAGFPNSMVKDLRPETMGRVATELLASKEHYTVLTKAGEAVAFGHPRKTPVATERLLNVIEHTIPAGSVDYHRALVIPARQSAVLQVAGAEERPVVRGDLVRAGVQVEYSPVGTVMPSVQSFVVRLACTNGATAMNVLREYHAGRGGDGDGNIWQWFRKSMREAYRALGAIIDRWQELRNEQVPPEQRAAVLAALLKEAAITGPAAEAVRARAVAETPGTMYDMLNLITWATTHVLTEPRQVIRAQHAAATLASSDGHRRVCPRCGRG